MAWENRKAGVGHYSDVPDYTGTAYGMNRPGNWESGWSPTSEMSKPRSTLIGSYYDPSSFNKTPEMWEKNMAGSEPYASPSQGYDRLGSARGDLGGSNYRNIELANRRGIGSISDEDEGMGMIGHAKQALSGFKWPSFMLMDSMIKNQAQHKDLDKYFQSTAGDNWRKAKDLAFFDKQGFLDAAQTGNRGLLSGQGNQAYGRFSRAGITDNVLEKFMDPSYKFYGNEAWLRSQASDNELFDEGMSFLKNAADTSKMHGMMTRGPIQDAAEAGMVEPGITGRPDWDTFDSEMVEPGIPGRPDWDTFDERYSAAPGGIDEDITNDIDFRSGIGQSGGYTEISRPPGGYLDVRDTLPQEPSFWEAPFEHMPFYSSPLDFNFKPEGWDQEYPGQDLEYLLDPEEYYKKVYKQKYIPPFKR